MVRVDSSETPYTCSEESVPPDRVQPRLGLYRSSPSRFNSYLVFVTIWPTRLPHCKLLGFVSLIDVSLVVHVSGMSRLYGVYVFIF